MIVQNHTHNVIARLQTHCARLGITTSTYTNTRFAYTKMLTRMAAQARKLDERIAQIEDAMRKDGVPAARPAEVILSFLLPLGPSTNHLYVGTGANRTHSPRYIAWAQEAGLEINAQRPSQPARALPADQPYTAMLLLSPEDAGDINNRDKALIDLLHRMHVTPDDRFMDAITVRRDPTIPKGKCVITVKALKPVEA